jgi:hypothetical protein
MNVCVMTCSTSSKHFGTFNAQFLDNKAHITKYYIIIFMFVKLALFFFESMVAWKLFGNVFVVQVVDCYKYDFVIKSVGQPPSSYF